MKPLPLVAIGIALSLLATGAVVLLDGPAEASTLTKFASEQELRQFVNARSQPNDGSKGYAEASSAASPASYSGTNVQVKGVDEGDLIKTDGEEIFIAEGGIVHIIGTSPSLHNITDINVSASADAYTSVQDLYVYEGRLVVLLSCYGHVSGGSAGTGAMYLWYPSSQETRVLVYNVSDPSVPSLERSIGISGSSFATRMVGPVVYLVTEQSVWSAQNISLPEVRDGNGTNTVDATTISYDPACPEASFFVNLLALDIVSGRMDHLSSLAGPSSVVYMSPTSLYLTMTHYPSSIGPMVSSDASVTTAIYRIGVNGTAMSLDARGDVPGWPLNQFALDEREGKLRVATTSSWSNPTSSVLVLDHDLKKVGELNGVAPGERIFSSRFLDDRLYLVTFRQVDPLFVIDLSTDTPEVLGELKIPGASTYLQMVDDGLLGIGFENGSVKVSLFNVSDPSNPFEVGNFLVDGYSYSAAQYDHRAVLYDPQFHMLVIPVSHYGTIGPANGYPVYAAPWSGAVVLELSGTGITLAGMIGHENATVQRSLYIGTTLYTISDTMVKANQLPSLEAAGELRYSEGSQYYGGYGVAQQMTVK